MIHVNDGQCGRCAHYGEHNSDDMLVQIRIDGLAPDGYINECGHPAVEGLHLRTPANGACDGFLGA